MKPTANMEIREIMLRNGVAQREIAARLGVHENTVGRWMRSPMKAEKAAQIIGIVNQIAGTPSAER